jgi:hypothetical protein
VGAVDRRGGAVGVNWGTGSVGWGLV